MGANIVKNIALEHDLIQAQKGRGNRFFLWPWSLFFHFLEQRALGRFCGQ